MAKLIAHQILAVGLSLYLLKSNTIVGFLALTFLALMSSIIPDFDLKLKHRVLLHSLPAAILATITVYIIGIVMNITFNVVTIKPIYHTMSFAIGYTSHIAMDMLTHSGIALLYPMSRKRYGILRVSYDNPIYNGVIIALGAFLLYLYFLSFKVT